MNSEDLFCSVVQDFTYSKWIAGAVGSFVYQRTPTGVVQSQSCTSVGIILNIMKTDGM